MKRDTFDAAIDRDPAALRALARSLAPEIRKRVSRALARSAVRRRHGSVPWQDGEDLVQEVFVALFDRDARVLRAWDEARGASLCTFVGIVAEHRIASILRSYRRRQCLPTLGDGAGEAFFERMADPGSLPDVRAITRQLGKRLLDRLQRKLSPRGYELFVALFIDEESVDAVCARWGMTERAVWARRCRLKKVVRQIAGELEPS